MISRKRVESRKARRPGKKTKPARPTKTAKGTKKAEKRKSSAISSKIPEQHFDEMPPQIRERYVITIEDIRGDTAIGDLLVTFPRTRDVLARKGLRLEAEDAGDIYMTLDAFSAMNGIEIRSLVQAIVEVAREPPTQQSPPQVVASPIP